MAPAAAAPPSVLLLTNGHVFQGEIVEDSTGFYLRHKIGVKQFARRNVAGVFNSLEEAYQYQRARLPDSDPDERMKLALWCLGQKLNAQAKEQLEAVVALSPENQRAKAMLFHLNARAELPVDAEVARASATDVTPAFAATPPRELNRTTLDQLREANRERPAAGPPLILDLPPPLAVRRYQEFARFVHAELQTHCAKCHDADTHAGAFRLYRARTKRDLANELILRANLDATLQLVDPANLPHSSLLTVAAMTHPPDGRPVLSGPNHPSYRILSTWVNSLKDTHAAQPGNRTTPTGMIPAQPPFAAPEDHVGEGFATGRNAAEAAAPAATLNRSAMAPVDTLLGAPQTGTPRMTVGLSGTASATSPEVPTSTAFPDPTTLVDPRQQPRATASPRASSNQKPSAQPAAPKTPGVVQMPDGTQALRLPTGELIPLIPAEALRNTPLKDELDPARQAIQAGARQQQSAPGAHSTDAPSAPSK